MKEMIQTKSCTPKGRERERERGRVGEREGEEVEG